MAASERHSSTLTTGASQFNSNPILGISYLVQHGHVNKGTPADIARFLHEHSDQLDKKMVGDYLGSACNAPVLQEYVNAMEFQGVAIDAAIRRFLGDLRLPDESQKIDRILEKFGERFAVTCASNAEAAFMLAFAVVLLQTDLHSPRVAEAVKMSKTQFVLITRDIDDAAFSEDYLGGIYDRIKETPLSLLV
ncbi:TPA: hypothetical protein N0F65_013042 [Lagenidium giganteum]|uniref:SEC7 domain-containing protein n=1 Tax=Lagenidium giganteum TaxID=4803 RepID=A0AAV2YJN0_9STRA|nr:TPA: hypothetical protein N0F65_013042 [Lagenidium giganteum]